MADYEQFPPVAYGTFDAWVTVTSANRKLVKKLLPGNCDLAPPNGTAPGEHPLVILAGRQTNVRSRFITQLSFTYLEAGILIPWVRCKDVDDSSTSLFRASLYLNRELPILMGRCLGLEKTHAFIANDQFTMEVVENEDEGSIFSASYWPLGSFADCSQASYIGLIESIFKQFHVGHWLNVESMPIACVSCDLNLRNAYVRPVVAEFKIRDSFCRAVAGSFGVPAIGDGRYGAFQLNDARWTMRFVRMT